MSDPAAASRRAFSYPGYRYFWLATMLTSFAVQIVAVSVGWQIYDITGEAILLGFVGLSLFLPSLLLVLVTGMTADRVNRRLIMASCLAVECVCAVFMVVFTAQPNHPVWPVFVVLVILGCGRAFMGPASSSLAPNLVPTAALSNAITLNATAWQFANILGPVAGGLLYGIAPSVAFGTAAALTVVGVICVSLIPKPARRESHQSASLETLLAGVRYIRDNRVVLGAISLDLFAVLLGGAYALMPIYAKDILHAGPFDLGLLRAGPGLGAIGVAIYLSRRPVRDYAGRLLFFCVAGFGFFVCVFGLSTSIVVAVPALMLVGACDMVSVSIRETIMQLWTPDEVRGRVNAVNSVFIGASNELGEFRSGVVAAWLGAVVAVVGGGIGTMAVAAIWSRAFPGLRQQRSLERPMVAGVGGEDTAAEPAG
ncbi:MAG: MFS transporter [Devosia sp.]